MEQDWVTVDKNGRKKYANDVVKNTERFQSNGPLPTRPYRRDFSSLSKPTSSNFHSNKSRFNERKTDNKKGFTPRSKRNPASIPDFDSEEERKKFIEIQKTTPHVMMPGQIRRIAATLNIAGLAEKMLGEEWIKLQLDGWKYERVIKPDDCADDVPDGPEYDIQDLGNKYGDLVVFKKV